jgi:hypothetical protein
MTHFLKAFNLNRFNFNHSILDASGCPVLTYSDQGE